ncbi:hypothetical protein AgCh_015361 [Apium graveolens]
MYRAIEGSIEEYKICDHENLKIISMDYYNDNKAISFIADQIISIMSNYGKTPKPSPPSPKPAPVIIHSGSTATTAKGRSSILPPPPDTRKAPIVDIL